MIAPPALVILAAGASTRLGECKATVELGGRSVLARLIEAGACLDSRPALVVTGAHHEEIAASAPEGVELLRNPRWAEGRSGGVVLARAARPGCDLCLAPVDVPLVPRAVFAALRERWLAGESPPRGWLAPRLAGSARTGHPVVVGRELLELLDPARPDRPLRELRAAAEPLFALDVSHPEILDDLDTPADLARLRARSRPN